MVVKNKVLGFHLLFFLHPLVLTVAGLGGGGEKALHLVQLHSISHPTTPSHTAVTVASSELPVVSSRVVAAEAWLRTHVLAYYPSVNISTIVVGRGVLCTRGEQQVWGLVLPSVKNLYYSLLRWGLVREIRVSASFSSECLVHGDDGVDQDVIKPLLSFIHGTRSVYVVDHPFNSLDLTSYHGGFLERLGFSGLRDIRVVGEAEVYMPRSRKLSSLRFPSLPELRKAPRVVLGPPPLPFSPVPDGSFSFAPVAAPDVIPGISPAASPDAIPVTPPPDVLPESPPSASVLAPPPCVAALVPVAAAPPPGASGEQKGGLWCVAKPAVPAEKLQEAIDYACGEGRADCEEIMPNGKCYFPDNLVAHASYAFNSYWQKNKQAGGSCNFDGTALLISSDPSFLQCQFTLS